MVLQTRVSHTITDCRAFLLSERTESEPINGVSTIKITDLNRVLCVPRKNV